MRTGVRLRAVAQVIYQVFQLRPRQRVVGFRCMTADGFGYRALAEPRGVHLFAGCRQFVIQVAEIGWTGWENVVLKPCQRSQFEKPTLPRREVTYEAKVF